MKIIKNHLCIIKNVQSRCPGTINTISSISSKPVKGRKSWCPWQRITRTRPDRSINIWSANSSKTGWRTARDLHCAWALTFELHFNKRKYQVCNLDRSNTIIEKVFPISKEHTNREQLMHIIDSMIALINEIDPDFPVSTYH